MTIDDPETILIFAANPVDQPRLNLDHEVREIENGLRQSRKHFVVKQQWATRPKDLRRALLDNKPAYVHFCGHGAGRNGIVLEGQLVDAEALAGLFKLFSDKIKCVVLNACYSTVQAQAIAQHIEYVVGMNKAIGDSAAIEFAAAFYDALGAGESVDFAFALGCNAIQMARIPEHLTPELLKRSTLATIQQVLPSVADPEPSPRRDWDGAPAVSQLYGREAVAELLRSWILDECCRVILINGLGGVGKTDLATCLGRGGNRSLDTSATLSSGIQGNFDSVMWRSLLNAPPPEDLFADMLDFLSVHRRTARHSLNQQLEDILSCLQNQHCLIILDNVEAILRPGDPSMRYRDGYEPYGAFFEQVAKTSHQSCLLLTSREKPHAIAELEGARKPVRSLALSGIGTTESQSLFAQIGNFSGSENHWDQIVKLYNGNPLALELAARHIDQVFDGDLVSFLGSGRSVFADLEELLDWHLDRLTKEETELVYWLAIEREPINLITLYDNLISPISRQNVASTLQSLQRRIPLERVTSRYFSLQPVLIEQVTERLISRIISAFTRAGQVLLEQVENPSSGSVRRALNALQLLNTHSLVKAKARENVRDSQERLILGPIVERLAARHGRELGTLCTALLDTWRRERADEPGYMAGNIINLLSHLNIDLHGINFSSLRIWQACLHEVNLHATDFSFADFRHTTFRHAFGTVFSLSYSPGGEWIAVGDDNGEILLFFASNGDFHMRCVGHSDVVSAITFSPDGQIMASSSFDNTIRLWSAKDGHCINILAGHEGWVYSLAFSPDGETLASASEDGTCRLWNLKSGRWIVPETSDPGFVSAVVFSPDGQQLAVAGSGRVVSLFQMHDLDHPVLLREHTGRVRSLAFSPQGDMLASGAEDHKINLWEPAHGTLLGTLSGHSGDVMSLSFSAVGDLLASASQDHTVRLWSTARKECVARLDVASARVWAVDCSPTGRTLATGSEDGTIRVWDMDTCQCLTTLRGYSNKSWSLSFSADPSILLAANEDGLVRLWNTRDGQTRSSLRGHTSRVWAVSASVDGRWVASASDDGTVRLWDLPSGTCRHTMYGHVDWIRSVAFDPESKLLASSGEDGKIFIWDVASGTRLTAIQCQIPRVFSITFCKDGKWLAAGGAAHGIHLFSVPNGNYMGELLGHKGWLTNVTHIDVATLASCSEDGTIKFWDLRQSECSATFDVGSDVWCGDYSRRWVSFLSGSEDGMLRRWAVGSGLCEAEVRAHQSSIRSLTVNVTEDIVATTGDDGAIRLWALPELTPATSPNILRSARPYEGMNITGAVGLTSAQREALMVLGAIAMPTP
jgi:WD40 repeat protein